jgi:hypothetical protein
MSRNRVAFITRSSRAAVLAASLGLIALATAHLQAATPMAGITSSNKFLIYYGDDFSTSNLVALSKFDVVVLDANVANCLPSSVAYLQTHGVKYVLGYISIGEEPSSVGAPLPGNGDGPVYFDTNTSSYIYESNGVASFYVDQEWNGATNCFDVLNFRPGTAYVEDGLPDTNHCFGGRFIWPNSDWQWVITYQRIGGSSELPTRSLAGLQQLMGTRTSDTDSNRNDSFGLNGVFLDTLDTAGPFQDVWGYYAWAAPEMQQTVKYIHDTYTNKTVFANRGLFFYNPTIKNTVYNIRPYDYTIRPYINASLFESYTLDSNPSNPGINPSFGDNKYDYAPKMIAEANRSDGFTIFVTDYQEGRSNSLYQQAMLNCVVSNGWVDYQAPDGGLATIGTYMLSNPPPADTKPPVWDSTAATSSTPVPPRIGVQSVTEGANVGDAIVHWDVARDQTTPVHYNIQWSTNAAFTSVNTISNVVFSIGDGWGQDPTTAFANMYVVTQLDPESTNYFRVRAHDSTPSKFEETNTVVVSFVVKPNEVSNPATTNIVVDGRLPDWTKLRSFGTDSNDLSGASNAVDWISGWMAHDDTRFYIAFTNDGPVTINSAINIYFDTDANRATGFLGGGNNFPIGAEYLLQGASLFRYGGTGLDFTWDFLGSVSWSVSNNTAECSLPRTWLDNSSNIKLIFYGDNTGTGGSVDYFPDSAPQFGGGGGRFTYRVRDFSNPLTNITLDGNLSDWAPYRPFDPDLQDIDTTNQVDFLQAWMGHSSNLFYVAYKNASPTTYDDRFNLYLDTDGSRTTGYRNSNDEFPIGADYRVRGTNVQHYVGTGLNSSWTNIGVVAKSVASNIIEYSFPRSWIGDPPVINLFFWGENTGDRDEYPDYAMNAGGGGQFFTYRKNDVSNPVTNGAIIVNGSLTDWASLKPFGTDPQDATGAGDQLDWGTSWMAHDPTNFYFAHQTYTTITALNTAWNTYLDTDGNRLTGFRGSGDNYPLGADYLLQGTGLYHYTGTGTNWSWSFIGTVAYSWSSTAVEFSFPRSWVGNPSLVKVLFVADNPSVGGTTTDYSPDTALKTGGGGVSYTYRTQ